MSRARRAGSIRLRRGFGGQACGVRYADAEDSAANAIVKKPVAVYVERVYEEGDFSTLGFGT